MDDDRDELWVVQGELNMRVPKSKGIVGAVATSGNVSKKETASRCCDVLLHLVSLEGSNKLEPSIIVGYPI